MQCTFRSEAKYKSVEHLLHLSPYLAMSDIPQLFYMDSSSNELGSLKVLNLFEQTVGFSKGLRDAHTFLFLIKRPIEIFFKVTQINVAVWLYDIIKGMC